MAVSGGPVDDGQTVIEEQRSLAMLVTPDRLPGTGWRVTRDRTWVTGELDPDSDKSRRAREAGVVTAWRSFEQVGNGRSAWVEVVPYATAEDAALSLHQSPRYFVGADGPDESLVAGAEVPDQELPGVPNLWVYEKTVAGSEGVRVSRYAAGTIGPVLFIASCAGEVGDWCLDDLMELALTLAVQVSAGTCA